MQYCQQLLSAEETHKATAARYPFTVLTRIHSVCSFHERCACHLWAELGVETCGEKGAFPRKSRCERARRGQRSAMRCNANVSTRGIHLATRAEARFEDDEESTRYRAAALAAFSSRLPSCRAALTPEHRYRSSSLTYRQRGSRVRSRQIYDVLNRS